jgi:hypothetical protein
VSAAFHNEELQPYKRQQGYSEQEHDGNIFPVHRVEVAERAVRDN